MSRAWTKAEIKLLGTKPDADVGRLIGRTGKAIWAKRQSLGIPAPVSLVKRWAKVEDKVVLSKTVAEAAALLDRTQQAVRNRRSKLLRKLHPHRPMSFEQAMRRISVPRYDSPEQKELVRFVGGPYHPPRRGIGDWLNCELRGKLEVGGYSNALIPWPLAAGRRKQLIVCGDLVRALKTESRLAVSFHFGISQAIVSDYRSKLDIERLTAGSTRLFWRSVNLARTDEARAKISKAHEGRGDTMTPAARARLRKIQRRPKTEAWKRKMSRYWKKRMAIVGRPEKWTPSELKLIGTQSDHKVARLVDRSVSAVRAKKFQLRRSIPKRR